MAIAVHKPFVEVAPDLTDTGLLLEHGKHRVRVGTVHRNLAEDIKRYARVIVLGAGLLSGICPRARERLDVTNTAWLLVPKLVAGKSKDVESLALVLLVQGFKLRVRRLGFASERRDVCKDGHRAHELAELHHVAVRVPRAKAIDGSAAALALVFRPRRVI